jgi:hypothetical protein
MSRNPPWRPEDARPLRHTYTGYSIGSAAVWAVILAVGQRRLDAQTWKALRLGCAGWWSGWTSATIARVGYPAPKKLTPQAERRLGMVSLALVAVGLISVIRLLVTGNRPESGQADVP